MLQMIRDLLRLGDSQPDRRYGVKSCDFELLQSGEHLTPLVLPHPDDGATRVQREDHIAEQTGDVADGQVGEGAEFFRLVCAFLHFFGDPFSAGEGHEIGLCYEISVREHHAFW
jgi:hypothetical protein